MSEAPATTGEQHVEQVMQDIACPQCDYNLRGLYGPVVDCPECGQRCEIAKLIQLRWEKPWWSAPGYNKITRAGVWVVFGPFLIGLLTFAAVSLGIDQESIETVIYFGLALYVGVWLFFLWRAYHLFASLKGVAFALLCHLIIAAYFMLLGAAYILLVGFPLAVYEKHYVTALLCALLCAPIVYLAILARRGERWIARQCINRHLQHIA